MHHTHTTRAAGLLLTAAALTACTSTTDAAPKPSPSRSTTKASPSPSPSPSGNGQLALGQPSRWRGTGYSGTTTALTYTQPVKLYDQPDKSLGFPHGGIWVTVEIKVCNNAGSVDITVSQFPWQLGFPDGSRIEVTGLNGGDFPKPEFPTDDTTVRAGDCLRGKIPFAIGKGTRPDRIIYGPEGGQPAVWTVPAK